MRRLYGSCEKLFLKSSLRRHDSYAVHSHAMIPETR